LSIEQKNKGAQQNECNNKIDRQRQTETERDGHIEGHRQREKVIIKGKFNFESRDWACLQPKVLLIRMGKYQNFFFREKSSNYFFKH
jgi:hypothetical protein